MRKLWNVAIYTRVSTDKKNQQESIPAQVQSLKKWLIDKGTEDINNMYNLVEVYEDQGFSGSNFERDSFKRMKEDIELGKINMVLTRDLSRFSRNYIDAGYYIEDYFKIKGVRFVSILDNVDTIDDFNDIVPFKNILNEMYIKDCSKKTKDALRQRMLRGSSIANKAPYGYKIVEEFEGNVKTRKLEPANDEKTDVIKEIFNLYLGGWGMGKIATHLNKKNIPPPAASVKNFAKAKFNKWSNNTIQYILTNPKYGGYMVQGMWTKVSYKSKYMRKKPKDEWIYGGEFEGIISKSTFDKVQMLMKKRSKKFRYRGERIHIFTGVLQCNECGGSMCYRKEYKGYKCSNSQRGGGRCTAHSVKEEFLIKTVYEDFKAFIDKYIDKEELYSHAKKLSNKKSDYHKKLRGIEKELEKLDKQFESLYLDKLNEVISLRNFERMTKSIEQKQNLLSTQKDETLELISRADNRDELFKVYKKEIDKTLSKDGLDRAAVDSLIDKIIVSEDSKTKIKSVDIYYRFES